MKQITVSNARLHATQMITILASGNPLANSLQMAALDMLVAALNELDENACITIDNTVY